MKWNLGGWLKMAFPVSSWLSANVWLPLTPFLLVTFLRAVLSQSWLDFFTFHFIEMSDLSLSLGLIGLLVRQSVTRAPLLLADEQTEEMRATVARNFEILGWIFLGLFIAIELMDVLVNHRKLQELSGSRLILGITTWVLAIWFYSRLIHALRHFKLVEPVQ